MDRIPFSITMKKDLLKKVDTLVDGTRIRNRSHAIEYIIATHFRPKIKKALILAGGEGVKMRPFTYELPKTMLPVKGRPIMEYIIELLREEDVRDIYVAIGYLGNKIKNHFGDGAKFGVRLTYLEEKKNLGTGGAIKTALLKMNPVRGVGHSVDAGNDVRSLSADTLFHRRQDSAALSNGVNGDPFLMIWGDELIDIDLGDLIEFHLENMPIMTIALTSVSDPTEYGAVRLHRDMVVEHTEKPKKTKDVSHLVSAGVHIVDPQIVSYLPKDKVFNLEQAVIPRLIKEGKIRGYLFEGQWFDVGTPEIYQRAIREWTG